MMLVAGATSSSLTVTTIISEDGFVYCGAWPAGAGVPSGSQVKARAYPVSATARMAKNVTISDLTALTSYDVYCYT
jgi:hypothetical protein